MKIHFVSMKCLAGSRAKAVSILTKVYDNSGASRKTTISSNFSRNPALDHYNGQQGVEVAETPVARLLYSHEDT